MMGTPALGLHLACIPSARNLGGIGRDLTRFLGSGWRCQEPGVWLILVLSDASILLSHSLAVRGGGGGGAGLGGETGQDRMATAGQALK